MHGLRANTDSHKKEEVHGCFASAVFKHGTSCMGLNVDGSGYHGCMLEEEILCTYVIGLWPSVKVLRAQGRSRDPTKKLAPSRSNFQ